MPRKKLLFISGSLGLGHVTRDLAIAAEIRRCCAEAKIVWLAAEPASAVLRRAGEELLEESCRYANDNVPAEDAARGMRLDLLKYLSRASKEWKVNFEIFRRVTSREGFDIVIGDETYELMVGMQKEPDAKKAPFVMIYDFIGLAAR